MYTKERFDRISAYLKEKKKATVGELAALLCVSSATIRRDLSEMQALGIVARTHGGVLYIEDSEETSIYVRLDKNAQEKEGTALIAAHNLGEFQTAFVDNSSTCFALANRLDLKRKTIITNGLQLALTLSQRENVDIIMPGGEVKFNTAAVLGSLACNTLSHFRTDIILCSCAALDEFGVYEHSLDSCELKKVALERGKRKILLADRTKFGRTAAYRTCSLAQFDEIYTNADDKTVAAFRERGLNVINKLNAFKP